MPLNKRCVKLSRRYELCDWTTVYTTTLLTAEDEQDTVTLDINPFHGARIRTLQLEANP